MDSASTNTSFSSSLLDHIYRSFDEPQPPAQSTRKKPTKLPLNIRFEDDQQRACLIQNWIDNKARQNTVTSSMRYTRDSFRLNSSSTSSDIESLYGVKVKPKPKPIRTANDTQTKDKFVKTKSKALKIYTDLKKVKQPISPGGRLATFLNSLFTNKKSNDSSASVTNSTEAVRSHVNRKSKSANASTCSSASSFSRSCLSNTSSSRGKLINGIKRSVTFYDEDCQPCGHKSLHKEEMSLKSNKEVKLNLSDKNRQISEAARNLLKSYQKKVECGYENLSDDGGSDSSSDLFELDNLSGMHGYREELPVYETTQLDASRLFM